MPTLLPSLSMVKSPRRGISRLPRIGRTLGFLAIAWFATACGGETDRRVSSDEDLPHWVNPAAGYVIAVLAGDGSHTSFEVELPADGQLMWSVEDDPLTTDTTLPDFPADAELGTIHVSGCVPTTYHLIQGEQHTPVAGVYCSVEIEYRDLSVQHALINLCRADLTDETRDSTQAEWRVIPPLPEEE